MLELDERGFAEKAAVAPHSTAMKTKMGEVEREEERTDESKTGGRRRNEATNVHIKRAVKSL